MNRKNSILIPCLIIGELFTMYVSYVLNGVWNTNGDIVLILNKFNAAIKNPFGHYYNANTLRAVWFVNIRNGSFNVCDKQKKSYAWQGIWYCKICRHTNG